MDLPERIEDSTLIINKSKSQFYRFSRGIRLELLSSFSNLELRLQNVFNKLNINIKPIIFSKNILINRLLIIAIFIITIPITLSFVVTKNNFNQKDFLKKLISFYLYLLKKMNYKIHEGETLISFSDRMASDYPKLSNPIYKIKNLYNDYRFGEIKPYPQKIFIFLLLLRTQITIIIYLLFNSRNR